MPDRIIEEHIHTDGGGAGTIALAIVLFLIVLMLVLYFTGAFGRMFHTKHEIDININKPQVILLF